MRRIASLLLILSATVLAEPDTPQPPYDFDADGETGMGDLMLLAGQWLQETTQYDLDESGRVDCNDFSLFAAYWLDGHINQAPVAQAQALTVNVGEAMEITLTATDPEHHALTYAITAGPSIGKLRHIAGARYRYMAYSATEAGTDTFTFTAGDGELVSEPNTVTITLTAPVLDTLRMSGRAELAIDNGDSINVDDSFFVSCWFRTRWPYGVLLSKRASAGGPGLTVTVEGGCVVTRLWDQDGTRYVIEQWTKVDGGQWWFYGLNVNPGVTQVMLNAGADRDFEASDTNEISTPGLNLSSAAPLRVGTLYYGGVDYVANSAAGTSILGLAGATVEGRSGVTNMFSPVYYRRFLINEGTGEITRDETATVEGQLTDHGRVVWSTDKSNLDSRGQQRSRLRGVDGSEIITNHRRRR